MSRRKEREIEIDEKEEAEKKMCNVCTHFIYVIIEIGVYKHVRAYARTYARTHAPVRTCERASVLRLLSNGNSFSTHASRSPNKNIHQLLSLSLFHLSTTHCLQQTSVCDVYWLQFHWRTSVDEIRCHQQTSVCCNFTDRRLWMTSDSTDRRLSAAICHWRTFVDDKLPPTDVCRWHWTSSTDVCRWNCSQQTSPTDVCWRQCVVDKCTGITLRQRLYCSPNHR